MAELDERQRQMLARSAVFAELPAALRADIVAAASVRTLRHGELLFTRGARADGWYAVLSGAIRVGAVTEAGREIALAYLEPGTFFGEISLFDGLPRSHDNHAHGDTCLLFVARADFRVLLDRHPALCEALLRQLCHRVRLLFAAVEEISMLTLDARLARQLLALARSYGEASAAGTRIGIRLHQEALAQLLGVSRQRINQELRALERDGVIAQAGGYITVCDGDVLQRLGHR